MNFEKLEGKRIRHIDYEACVREYVKYKADETGFSVFDTVDGIKQAEFEMIWLALKKENARGTVDSCIYCILYRKKDCVDCSWKNRYGDCNSNISAFSSIKYNSSYQKFIHRGHGATLDAIEEKHTNYELNAIEEKHTNYELNAKDFEIVDKCGYIVLRSKIAPAGYIIGIDKKTGTVYRYLYCSVPGLKTDKQGRIKIRE